MSEYLTRLVTRARESDARQLLRPSVRSSSPIAEHDQRVGMVDFEGFELVGAPPDLTRSERAVGNLGEFQSERRSGVQPEIGMGETLVQRKTAAPGIGMTGPSPDDTPAGPPASNEWMGSGIHTATRDTPGSKVLPSREATEVETGIAELAAENEPPGSAAESARTDDRRSDSLAIHDTIREASQVNVHARSVRPESEIDSPRLEPKMPVFIDGVEPSPGDSAASPAAVDHGPRVVIGRINVEVVPPAVQQGTSAPRSGPLTAASVSVIGPLGGIRPNMRLSLRYR